MSKGFLIYVSLAAGLHWQDGLPALSESGYLDIDTVLATLYHPVVVHAPKGMGEDRGVSDASLMRNIVSGLH